MTEVRPIELHVPEPQARPGETPDFSYLEIPPVGKESRPDPACRPTDTHHLAGGLIRVLDDDGHAHGEWSPDLSDDAKIRGLRHMLQTKKFDEMAVLLQRQAKSAFAMRSRGEEAVAVSCGMAVDATSPGYGPGLDMHFPTYRQSGLLFANGHDTVEAFCQLLSNDGDRLHGAQLPCLHSVPEAGFFSISGNLGTQVVQAVGWGMAAAIEGKRNLGVAWVGEGATAENDFHSGMVFASVYQPPTFINVVNNQWAISSFQGFAGGENATFAQRGIGYGMATLRVDGNDFLASYSAAEWATDRARSGHGPTIIEWVTYRAASHSSSDDPTKYRPLDAYEHWPLGDPIERLRDHLLTTGALTEEQSAELDEDVNREINAALDEAEEHGTLNSGENLDPGLMFSYVYEHLPRHLEEQQNHMDSRP